MKLTKSELREVIRECLREELANNALEEAANRGDVGKLVAIDSNRRRKEIAELASSLADELRNDSDYSAYEYREANYMYAINNTKPTEAGVIGLICIAANEADSWWTTGNDAFTFKPGSVDYFVKRLNSTATCKERTLHFSARKDMCSDTELYVEVWNYGDYYNHYE